MVSVNSLESLSAIDSLKVTRHLVLSHAPDLLQYNSMHFLLDYKVMKIKLTECCRVLRHFYT